MRTIIKPGVKTAVKSVILLAAAVFCLLLSMGFSSAAHAQTDFAAAKTLCLGAPSDYTPFGDCPYVVEAPEKQPVFYVIKVTNLPWQPQKTIKLTEQIPDDFNAEINNAAKAI